MQVVSDVIADMLTRIRNANIACHQIVQVPATKMTTSITNIFKEEGFINNYEVVNEGLKSYILISLKYKGKKRNPVITALKRISKPGLRVYANHKEIPRVLGGLGVAIISTSKGLMTDKEARRTGLGGEIICYIW
uniref:ribosomal protein S8 n=1 Tax=Timspurckia oligopyrenoides TaxID=708627 RepID=UPI001FCD2D59|nr:ribosomal protein S8 [Timspurckia oligopyrenoides]UNJ17555.1 ribosomal protein S8 [Timspurckia oligopyrenoides]